MYSFPARSNIGEVTEVLKITYISKEKKLVNSNIENLKIANDKDCTRKYFLRKIHDNFSRMVIIREVTEV